MKKVLLGLVAISAAIMSTGCNTDASVASRNLSKAADMFELSRRIVFYNGITSEYILVIEGKCSLGGSSKSLAVTCKTNNGEFKKHYLGLSDNVTYFSEQINSANVSTDHYKVIFKPSAIIPDIDLK
tara:strand:- start:248 stop:628 length:381 start_codon:yes stop_codon:yes gene_type:complete